MATPRAVFPGACPEEEEEGEDWTMVDTTDLAHKLMQG
jgi:hypothetical protein